MVKDKIVPLTGTQPGEGLSSDSVVVFVVRKGNPKHIAGWTIWSRRASMYHAQPSTSGSAVEHSRWYGATRKAVPAQALAYVKTLLPRT